MKRFVFGFIAMTCLGAYAGDIDYTYNGSCNITNNGFFGATPLANNIEAASHSLEKLLEKLGCTDVDITSSIQGHYSDNYRVPFGSNEFTMDIEAYQCQKLQDIQISKFDCRDGLIPSNDKGKRDIVLELNYGEGESYQVLTKY